MNKFTVSGELKKCAAVSQITDERNLQTTLANNSKARDEIKLKSFQFCGEITSKCTVITFDFQPGDE